MESSELKGVPQSGLIPDVPKPTLWMLGAETAIPYSEDLQSGDWRPYEPTGEEQARMFVFDTKGCVPFSYTNVVETRLNWMIATKRINPAALEFLKSNGYIDENGKVNFSDKHLYIRSGNNGNGSNQQTICEVATKVGLIPERLLPSNINSTGTLAEWMDLSQITPAMDALGLQFLRYFELPFQMVFFDSEVGFDPAAATACVKAFKQSPIQLAIPRPAYHSIEGTFIESGKQYGLFDSYEPFRITKIWKKEVHYAMQIVASDKVVAPAPVTPTLPPSDSGQVNWSIFKRPISRGTTGDDVLELQKVLKALGYFNADPWPTCGPATVAAIKAFQKAAGFPLDYQTGTAWLMTFEALKIAIAKPTKATSEAGKALIKQFEGLHDGNTATAILEPKRDPVGLPTIGWGARYDKDGNAVTMQTAPITLAEAEALLSRDLRRFEECVNKAVKRILTQGQFDALVSFAYNIGTAGFLGSNLLSHIPSFTVTRADFLEYVKARQNGVLITLPGLVARRNAEATLYGLA